jgi:hypothetical protein
MINSVNIASREVGYIKSLEEIQQEGKPFFYAIRPKHISNIESMIEEIRINKIAEKHRTMYTTTGLIWWNKISFPPNPNEYYNFSELRKEWADKYDKALYGQDLIFDMDVKVPKNLKDPKKLSEYIDSSFHKVHAETLKVCNFFDKKQVPYCVNFSGKKGFHIRILWEWIAKAKLRRGYNAISYENMYRKLAEKLELKLKLKYLDTSTLGRRQLIRIPYSIHSSGYVCLPLDRGQLQSFSKEMALPENVLRLSLWGRHYYPINKGHNRNMPVFNKGEENFNNIKSIIK